MGKMMRVRQTLAIMGLLSVFGSGSVVANQATDKAESRQVCILKVSGMSCGACAARVEKSAKKIDGVTSVKVSQPKGTAEIRYDPKKTTPEAIAKTITEKSGFKSEVTAKDQKG